MTIKIPANAKKAEINEILKSLDKNKKPFDARDFIGKIKFNGDTLAFQRDIR